MGLREILLEDTKNTRLQFDQKGRWRPHIGDTFASSQFEISESGSLSHEMLKGYPSEIWYFVPDLLPKGVLGLVEFSALESYVGEFNATVPHRYQIEQIIHTTGTDPRRLGNISDIVLVKPLREIPDAKDVAYVLASVLAGNDNGHSSANRLNPIPASVRTDAKREFPSAQPTIERAPAQPVNISNVIARYPELARLANGATVPPYPSDFRMPAGITGLWMPSRYLSHDFHILTGNAPSDLRVGDCFNTVLGERGAEDYRLNQFSPRGYIGWARNWKGNLPSLDYVHLREGFVFRFEVTRITGRVGKFIYYARPIAVDFRQGQSPDPMQNLFYNLTKVNFQRIDK